jgi:hypothetical protein
MAAGLPENIAVVSSRKLLKFLPRSFPPSGFLPGTSLQKLKKTNEVKSLANFETHIEKGEKGYRPLFKIHSPVLGNLNGKWVRLTPVEDLDHEYPGIASAQEALKKAVPSYLEKVHLNEMAAGHEGGHIGKPIKTSEDAETEQKKKWDDYVAKMTSRGGKHAKRNISYRKQSG